MPALAVLTRPTDGDADDRDLVAGVRAGDDRAFEVLFQRYQPRIAAYVRGIVRDHGRAEDITQEVFLSALRRMREDSERDLHFKPWIYEIARNRCIDAFRRSRTTSEVSFDARDAIGAAEHGRLAEPGATPDSAVEGKVAIDNLCGAFGALSQVHHDILVLRELEGLSYREIGDRLGLSRPAVESTLFRARKRLTEEYEEIVSGARCLRVQRIVDAGGGGAAGLRDQRRMARHLAHCQPCRRYAGRAGIDPGAASRPAAVARIAALVPLPAFLRRRGFSDDAGPLLGHGSAGQWSANIAAAVDPGLASSWAKAVATAATVAVAGIGAGAALSDRAPLGGGGAASPSEQAPALGLSAGGHDGAAPERAPAVERGALGAPRAPAARAPRTSAVRPARTGPAPIGAPPETAPANGPRLPALPFDSDSSGPAPHVGRETAAPRFPAAPGSVRELGRVLGAGAGAGAGAGSAGTTDVPALLGGATAPVAGAAGTVDATGRAPVASIPVLAPAATAAVGSVSSTVTETIASTTTTLNALG